VLCVPECHCHHIPACANSVPATSVLAPPSQLERGVSCTSWAPSCTQKRPTHAKTTHGLTCRRANMSAPTMVLHAALPMFANSVISPTAAAAPLSPALILPCSRWSAPAFLPPSKMLAHTKIRARPPHEFDDPPSSTGTVFAVHSGSPLIGPTLLYDELSKTMPPGPSLTRQ